MLGIKETPNTDGTAVPVGLITDPWAHQFAYASQMGKFDFLDAGNNSLDPRIFLPFPDGTELTGYPDGADIGWEKDGLNVIILNGVARPLKLVEMHAAVNDQGFVTDFQMCYPQGSPEDMSRIHEIPAARTYPNSGSHLTPGGQPAMFAGFGWWRFDTTKSGLSRAFSFQLGDDTTQHVGVIVRLDFRSRGALRKPAAFGFVGVTADLEKEYVSLDKFFDYKMPNPHNTPWGPALFSQSAADRGGLTVWGCPIPHDMDRLGTNSVVVWVRDVASTVG